MVGCLGRGTQDGCDLLQLRGLRGYSGDSLPLFSPERGPCCRITGWGLLPGSQAHERTQPRAAQGMRGSGHGLGRTRWLGGPDDSHYLWLLSKSLCPFQEMHLINLGSELA